MGAAGEARRAWCACVPALLVLLLSAPAWSATGETKWTVDGGGTRSTGGAFAVTGTIGQPDAGVLTGGTFALLGGFWFGGTHVLAVSDSTLASAAGRTLALAVAPNPCRSTTTLRFDLPRAGHVQLGVYDASGRQVSDVTDATLAPGTYAIAWRAQAGERPLPSGLYFVRLRAGAEVRTARMMVLR